MPEPRVKLLLIAKHPYSAMFDACAIITALMKGPENNFQLTLGRWKFNLIDIIFSYIAIFWGISICQLSLWLLGSPVYYGRKIFQRTNFPYPVILNGRFISRNSTRNYLKVFYEIDIQEKFTKHKCRSPI